MIPRRCAGRNSTMLGATRSPPGPASALGRRPRLVATTTPRPQAFLRDLAAQPGTVVTRGSTYDNRANLPPSFLSDLQSAYGDTALGRQEGMGNLL